MIEKRNSLSIHPIIGNDNQKKRNSLFYYSKINVPSDLWFFDRMQ